MNDLYTFEVDNLYYTSIERPILRHYQLGTQNSSNLPSQLNENDSGEYIISGTDKSMEFYLEIKKQPNGNFIIVCYPV